MKLSPHYLKRYKDIAMLLLKYGHSATATSKFGAEQEANLTPHNGENGDGKSRQKAQDLPNDLERLGPTFVKLGQLLSSRPDLLPEQHVQALARLQDRVAPFPYEQVESIIETELGAPIGKIYSRFDREPLAAASLGQVHYATLHDGRPVVVKVQRPNIVHQIDQDFAALEEIARFLGRHTQVGQRYRLLSLLEEFENTLAHELDYRREAANMVNLARNLGQFQRIRVPLPIESHTTHKVLTMDYIPGIKITELSPSARLDVNGPGLAEELFHAYLHQILVDGLFHADPHPGNIFLTEDHRIALLDVGMVGRTTPAMQEDLLKLLIAVSEGQSDDAADIAIRIGSPEMDFEEADFRHKISQLVAEQQNTTLDQMDVGKFILNVSRNAADTGLNVPAELSLLGKTLLQLDQVGRILDPEFDPNAAVRRHAREMLNERLKSTLTEGRLFANLLEAKQFIGALPSRLNKILDAVGNAEINVNVKPSETEFLVDSARKVANRITTGLVLAALIVGAALLMRVPTRFQIFGYPGLAIICFLAAATGSFWLLLNILWQDHKSKQNAR